MIAHVYARVANYGQKKKTATNRRRPYFTGNELDCCGFLLQVILICATPLCVSRSIRLIDFADSVAAAAAALLVSK